MITVDSRTGSIELLPLFPKNTAKSGYLSYGDFAFTGKGYASNGNLPLLVGIERKTTKDLLSSMVSGRLSGHQLIGLLNSYNMVYLIIEGIWRCNPQTKILEYYRKGEWVPIRLGAREFMAREIYNYINTLTVICGVNCWRTQNKRETVTWIMSIYHWWRDKSMEEHRSHKQAHKPFVELMSKKLPLLHRVANELHGVGFNRSKTVAKHFGSLAEMVLAGEEEWRKIDGIGKGLSSSIVKEITGGK